MKIIKSWVEWNLNNGNSPDFFVEVDASYKDWFPSDAPIWNRGTDPEDTMVWAEDEESGIISFISMHDINDPTIRGGFGGAICSKTLKDGTVFTSSVCWSGRAGVLPFDALDVCVVDINGNRMSGYALRMDHAIALLAEHGGYVIGTKDNWDVSFSPTGRAKPATRDEWYLSYREWRDNYTHRIKPGDKIRDAARHEWIIKDPVGTPPTEGNNGFVSIRHSVQGSEYNEPVDKLRLVWCKRKVAVIN